MTRMTRISGATSPYNGGGGDEGAAGAVRRATWFSIGYMFMRQSRQIS